MDKIESEVTTVEESIRIEVSVEAIGVDVALSTVVVISA